MGHPPFVECHSAAYNTCAQEYNTCTANIYKHLNLSFFKRKLLPRPPRVKIIIILNVTAPLIAYIISMCIPNISATYI